MAPRTRAWHAPAMFRISALSLRLYGKKAGRYEDGEEVGWRSATVKQEYPAWCCVLPKLFYRRALLSRPRPHVPASSSESYHGVMERVVSGQR